MSFLMFNFYNLFSLIYYLSFDWFISFIIALLRIPRILQLEIVTKGFKT